MQASIIEVKSLIKRYKKAKENAVDGVSFTVSQGEFFALLGPNGAGKTTTISILTTILSKTSGEILIDGLDVEKNASDVRRRIGIIFQNPSLDLNLTAEENVRLHAVLYGLYPFRPTYQMMPNGYKNKVSELAKVLGIEKQMFDPVKTMSGGMKRKLEILRSLTHNPKVLFLDEPTSGLDPLSRKNLWEHLKNVRKSEKTTVFLTTHYLEEAEDADRVCIINKGKVVSLGTPSAIKKQIVEEYILMDAKNKNKLREEITKLKLPWEENGVFKVRLDGSNAQDIIKKINTKLTLLQIHVPTLEEAYLEIIGK